MDAIAKPKRSRAAVQKGLAVKEALKDKASRSYLRKSHDAEINLISPSEFFKEFDRPVESRLYTWMQDVQLKSEEMLDTQGQSRIVVMNEYGESRIKKISTTQELREILKDSQKHYDRYIKIRENQKDYAMGFKSREDFFSNDSGQSNISGLPVRNEYSPLIGTPFFKQMYLNDYWSMHSKCFWYKNYSGIAKLIVEMTRNFVLGKGFNVQFDDEKAEDVWRRYEEDSNIQEEVRNWCDELTAFGENMLKKTFNKVPGGSRFIYKSFDPSTVWEIVTDPEDISDIKYYHQQYNTQYQLYGTKDAPISRYIINQLVPESVIHTRINVTSYEKRGRSDLLGALLYFKYYEDYIQAKLSRAKNEAAFIWDVSIDGSDEDVQAYINNTQDITDVPPGSENVHNKAITRTPLSPKFGKAGGDEIAQDILSYVAMSVSIPVNYFGTYGTSGNTKAGALVATEPVAKKMIERQDKIEKLLRRIVIAVLTDAGLDPKTKFEINFPEILEEDRSAKIQDLVIAKQENVISHETLSNIVAKELKISTYDYDEEQKKIVKESKNPLFNPILPPLGTDPGLTQDGQGPEDNGRAFGRADVKKQGHSF